MLAIGGFLERAEAVLDRLSRTPADTLVLTVVGKVDVTGVSPHGCFSPRAKASSAITDPVMQIMHELLELFGGMLMPPSVEEVSLGSHESSDVPSPLCLGFEKFDMQIVSIDDGVPKSDLLSAVLEAIAAREVCDFLATLAIAYPGSATGRCPQCRSLSITARCWSAVSECLLVLRCRSFGVSWLWACVSVLFMWV
jgi:hypothetical protein